jgi:hypothetical protein
MGISSSLEIPLGSTRRRTESSACRIRSLCQWKEERSSALFAGSFLGSGTKTRSFVCDEEFARSNAMPSTVVAGMTSGDQVVRIIVPAITIDVIGGQCSSNGWSRHPGHRYSAPVTGMRSWTDLVPQDEPMQRELTAGTSQGMPRTLNIAVARNHGFTRYTHRRGW